MSKAGWSQKAWLLGSHCHDSEGTSEAQRGESLIIAEIHFSFSLKMSCFFLYRLQDHWLSKKILRKNTRGFIVSPHRDTKILWCFLDVGGEMREGARTLIMRRCLDVITMGGKQVLHWTVSDAWLSVLTDRAWKKKITETWLLLFQELWEQLQAVGLKWILAFEVLLWSSGQWWF